MANQQTQESSEGHDKDVLILGVLVEIGKATEQCLEQAEEIIAEYWMWVDKSNKALRAASHDASPSCSLYCARRWNKP